MIGLSSGPRRDDEARLVSIHVLKEKNLPALGFYIPSVGSEKINVVNYSAHAGTQLRI